MAITEIDGEQIIAARLSGEAGAQDRQAAGCGGK
jgi:hypothetical protein